MLCAIPEISRQNIIRIYIYMMNGMYFYMNINLFLKPKYLFLFTLNTLIVYLLICLSNFWCFQCQSNLYEGLPKSSQPDQETQLLIFSYLSYIGKWAKSKKIQHSLTIKSKNDLNFWRVFFFFENWHEMV